MIGFMKSLVAGLVACVITVSALVYAQPPTVGNLFGRDLALTGRSSVAPQSVTVNASTTFAVTSSYVILACTGAETINTITGGVVGQFLMIEHQDTDCTIADDDVTTAADAIDLAGAATNDVGAQAKVITLYNDGSNWLQIGESEN